MKIKICGIKNLDEINVINETKPDFIGFIFAKTKREISFETAAVLKSKLDKEIKAVGVFVDKPVDEILKYKNIIDFAQLHSDIYTEDDIARLKAAGLGVFKVIRVKQNANAKPDFTLSNKVNTELDFTLQDKNNSNTKADYTLQDKPNEDARANPAFLNKCSTDTGANPALSDKCNMNTKADFILLNETNIKPDFTLSSEYNADANSVILDRNNTDDNSILQDKTNEEKANPVSLNKCGINTKTDFILSDKYSADTKANSVLSDKCNINEKINFALSNEACAKPDFILQDKDSTKEKSDFTLSNEYDAGANSVLLNNANSILQNKYNANIKANPALSCNYNADTKANFLFSNIQDTYETADFALSNKCNADTMADFASLNEYNINTKADFVLFDTFSPLAPGGINLSFNWNIKIKSNVPYFIAGGINAENIEQMGKLLRPYGADVSSGAEFEGIKTKEKVAGIIKIARGIKYE